MPKRTSSTGSELFIVDNSDTDWKVLRRVPVLFKPFLQDSDRSAGDLYVQLAAARRAVEKHIKNTYLKSAQAPLGVKPVLKCWMELN